MKTEYVWEKAYEAAVLETDYLKLPKPYKQPSPPLMIGSTICCSTKGAHRRSGGLAVTRFRA